MEWNELSNLIFSDTTEFRNRILDTTKADPETLVTDKDGSFFWSGGKGEKPTMLLFLAQPNGVMIKEKQNQDYLTIPLGKTKTEDLLDSICVSQNKTGGVLRESGKEKGRLLLKTGDTFSVGDPLYAKSDLSCKGDLLCNWQAGYLATLKLAVSAIKASGRVAKPISVAFVNESVSGQEKAIRLISQTMPDELLVCGAAKAEEGFSTGSGPALVIKDGNYVMDSQVRQKMERLFQESRVEIPYYIGDSKLKPVNLYLTAKTRAVCGLYLPVRAMGSRLEEISEKDVEKTQTLLLKYIENFVIITK